MKRKLFLVSILIATVILVISGCYNNRCIRGNDIVVTEYRNVGYFNSISSEGSFDVYIVQDTIEEVIIEAESNLMPYISTQVKGSTLILSERSNTCINNHFPIKVTVKCRDINELALTGSGIIYGNTDIITSSLRIDLTGSGNIDLNVEAANIEAYIPGSGVISLGVMSNQVEVRISGSGALNLWGEAERSDLWISGSGSINAYGLNVNTCYASISGSGSMYVYVNDLLDASISGSGSVYYKGHPNVTANITGSGSVIPEN